MPHPDEFRELTAGYLGGRISRRHFLERAAKLGVSTALLGRILPAAFAAEGNLVDSAPEAPHESPITKERIEFLKKKPFKGTTVSVMVLKATVGDGLKYYTKLWEEE